MAVTSYNLVIDCDFQANAYYWAGAVRAFADGFTNRLPYGGNPILAPQGLLVMDNGAPPGSSLPIFINLIYTQMHSLAVNGFTTIIKFTPEQSGSDIFIMSKDSTHGIKAQYSNPDIYYGDFSSLNNVPGNPVFTVTQIAMGYDPINNLMNISVDGNAGTEIPVVQPLNPSVTNILFGASMGVGTPNEYIQRFSVYDGYVPLLLLPQLSGAAILPPVFPPVVAGPTVPVAVTGQLPGIPIKYNNGLWR